MNKKIIILAIVILGVFSRVFMSELGFTPAFAAFLFAGYFLKDMKFGFLLPLATLFVTDLVIGLENYPVFLMITVYACYLFTFLLGNKTLKNKPVSIGLNSIGSSIFFFVVTNFISWIGNPAYPQNFFGLMTSFEAGIPFYRTGLVSDLFFSLAFFGLMYAFEKTGVAEKETVKN